MGAGFRTGPWGATTEDRAMDPYDDYAFSVPDSDTRKWAMLCHLGALTVCIGIPGFIVPLIVWLVKRNDHPYIDRHGKESLNFQISVALYSLALVIVTVILWITVVGILLTPLTGIAGAALAIAAIVLPIIAGIKASDGDFYRYPLTIRLID